LREQLHRHSITFAAHSAARVPDSVWDKARRISRAGWSVAWPALFLFLLLRRPWLSDIDGRRVEPVRRGNRQRIADIMEHEKRFEAAAMWYRLFRRAPKGKGVAPYVMHKE
jgi:hypothetical protein